MLALNTLIFFKVTVLIPHDTKLMTSCFVRREKPIVPVHTIGTTDKLIPKFNYELLNCNNFNIRYGSWNYRGCWHQTCPPIVPR